MTDSFSGSRRSGGATIAVELTRTEARALRLASIFGGPDKPHPALVEARRKLREAEAAHDAKP